MTSTPTSRPDAPSSTTLEKEVEVRNPLLPVRTSIPAGRVSRVLNRSILRFLVLVAQKVQGITRHVRGVEHLDDVDGPVIIACNHVSLLDSPVLHISLPKRHSSGTAVVGGLDFFAPRRDRSFLHVFWRRTVVWFIRSSVNAALIDRNGGDYSNLELIEGLLAKDWSLVIFPEATRSRSGTRGRMHLGVAELARRHSCPVLPAHVEGTNTVLPIGGRFPKPGVIRISIGSPMRIEESETTRMFVDRLAQRIDDVGGVEWVE